MYGGRAGAVAQLEALEAWFASQREFAFYSSSLLILYEGDAEGAAGAAVRVRLVDFAHTFLAEEGGAGERDDNFLSGLKAITSRLLAVCALDTSAGLL